MPEEAETYRKFRLMVGLASACYEYVQDHTIYPFVFDGEAYEIAYPEDVPGYTEDDVYQAFLKRESDGAVYTVDIDVTVTRVPDPPAGEEQND